MIYRTHKTTRVCFIFFVFTFVGWSCKEEITSASNKEETIEAQYSQGYEIKVDSVFLPEFTRKHFLFDIEPMERDSDFLIMKGLDSELCVVYDFKQHRVVDTLTFHNERIRDRICEPGTVQAYQEWLENGSLAMIMYGENEAGDRLLIYDLENQSVSLDVACGQGSMLDTTLQHRFSFSRKPLYLPNDELIGLFICGYGQEAKSFWDYNRLVTLNTQTGHTTIHNHITLPDPVPDEKYPIVRRYFMEHDDVHSIFLGTSMGPEIRLVKLEDSSLKVLKTVCVRSQYESPPPPAPPFKNGFSDNDALLRLSETGFWYDRILYNPYDGLLYRFYKNSMPEKKGEGVYTTYKDRAEGVIIFDRDFNVLGEHLFPKGWYYTSRLSFPLPDGGIGLMASIYPDVKPKLVTVKAEPKE